MVKRFRKGLIFIHRKLNFGILAVLLLISAVCVYDLGHTHSGRTDANGGHYNRKTGEYHYHNSGKPRPPVSATQATPLMNPAYTTSSQGQLTTQQQAVFDANLHVEQQVSAMNWFLAGAGCGVITFAYAVVDTPQVPITHLMGKPPDYIAVYTTEYQAKAKNKRIQNSCLGWGAFAVLYLAYLGMAD